VPRDTTIPTEGAVPRILGRGRFLELIDEGGWEYVRRYAASGVVVIVATTDAGQLVLVGQHRVPVHRTAIELPAGLIGDVAANATESVERAAARELEEETGFQARHWRFLAAGPSSVGLSTEIVTFFRATGLSRIGPGGGDDSEDITVHLVPLDGVAAFLGEKSGGGALIDPKVYAALHFLTAEKNTVTPGRLPTGLPFKVILDQPQGPLPFVPRADTDGGIVWEYTVDSGHHNPYDVLHGGVVMALLDSAMGHAVAAEVHGRGRFNAAAQMNVNFLAPVRAGVVRARARVVKVGKRLAVVEASAETADGTRVAIATATHSLLP
jgi:ADP-ribose pyrophosphatase